MNTNTGAETGTCDHILPKGAGPMIQRHIQIFLVLLTAGIIAGCQPRIPVEVTSRVTFRNDFDTLLKAPDQYIGEYAIFGGEVIRITNEPNFSEISVLQYPTDKDYRPDTDRSSRGRFLIRTKTFLDPAIYTPGQLITVGGNIIGGESRMIGGYDYKYPIINADQIWTWEEERGGFPRIQFGFGAATSF